MPITYSDEIIPGLVKISHRPYINGRKTKRMSGTEIDR
jgi:hypothetical protein